jgi:cytoskeletal protein CcmA (bactofilin family)
MAIMNSRQTGFSLLEILGALAIGSIMMLGMTSMIDTSMEDVKGQQAALHQSTVFDAAKKYLTANYATLKTTVASSPATAITMAQLRAGNFLPGGFSDTNAYGQTPCVLVTQSTPGRLDALIATSGGQQIAEKDVAAVAMGAGQGAGYIDYKTPTAAGGPSWKLPDTAPYRGVACGAGAAVLNGTTGHDSGHLVSNLFYDGQLYTDFLYRNAYPNRPELNQMNTPIQMASAALVDTGSDCKVGGVANAAFAIEKTTRTLLTCGTDGKWAGGSSWKEPVDTLASLPASGNTPGDVRMITDKNVAYTYDGTKWVALGTDWNGDLKVPRHITAGGTITGQDLVAVNTLDAGGTADIHGGAHFYQHIQVDGNATANGNLSVGGSADVQGGGHFHRHIQVDQDVNVGNNVNMGKDGATINMTGDNAVISMTGNYAKINMTGSDTEINAPDGGFIGQFTSQGHAELWDHHNPGDPCNYWMSDGHKSWIEFPIGTLIPDQNNIVMNCYSDHTFRYANGTYTP